MNDESLSALLDGECSPAELDRILRRLDHDAALRERFSRLSLAHDMHRGRVARILPPDFADRVLAALPERPDRVGAPLRHWRPLAGLAAAAAFGAVAVLALRPAPLPTAGTAVAGGSAGAVPLAAAAPPLAALENRDYAGLDDENARQLRNYLMAYSQSRAQQGVGGTLGYARYAAHTEGRSVDTSQRKETQR